MGPGLYYSRCEQTLQPCRGRCLTERHQKPPWSHKENRSSSIQARLHLSLLSEENLARLHRHSSGEKAERSAHNKRLSMCDTRARVLAHKSQRFARCSCGWRGIQSKARARQARRRLRLGGASFACGKIPETPPWAH